MTTKQCEQILKCRDERDPVRFTKSAKHQKGKIFKLVKENDETKARLFSWMRSNGESSFGVKELRSLIEPWLTALVQSEHLSLLVGSGLTHAVHGIACGEEAKLSGMGPIPFDTLDERLVEAIEREAKICAEKGERGDGNIEDQIRSATELLRGLEILKDKRADGLYESLEAVLNKFIKSILEGERNLAKAKDDPRQTALTNLVSFLMSFASRTGTRDRLHIFTTNYDRYIEAGADTAGLRLIDRFVGTLAPIFRASRLDVDLHYNPPGIRGEPRYLEGVARFTKLHGSVDWVDSQEAIRRIGLPFGAEDPAPYLRAHSFDEDARRFMVYPNAAKDRETAGFPYVELFRDFAAALCRPNSTLFCYGYSFGDDHINRVIDDMLTIPSTHLVVIAFDDPSGKIEGEFGKNPQVTLLVGNHLGDLRELVKHYLPKPAIDRAYSRMTKLLKDRWSNSQESDLAEHPKNNEGSSS